MKRESKSAAGLNVSHCLCLCSALEEEGLDVPQPPQGHQQEGLGLRQLELSARLRPCVCVGGDTWTWLQPHDWRHWRTDRTEERDDMVDEGTGRVLGEGLGGRGRRGVVSYLDGRPLSVWPCEQQSVHGLEGSTDAAKLQFSAVPSDDGEKEVTLTTSCVCPTEGDIRAQKWRRADVCFSCWPALFVFKFFSWHLLSLDWVVTDGGRTASTGSPAPRLGHKTGNHL